MGRRLGLCGVVGLVIWGASVGCASWRMKSGTGVRPVDLTLITSSYLTIGELSVDSSDQSLVFALENRSDAPIPADAAADIVVNVGGREVSRIPFSQYAQQFPQLTQPNARVSIDTSLTLSGRQFVSVMRDDSRGFRDANEYQKIRARTLDASVKPGPDLAVTGLYRDSLGQLVIGLTNRTRSVWPGGRVEIAMRIDGTQIVGGRYSSVNVPAINALSSYDVRIPLMAPMPMPSGGAPPVPPVHSRFVAAGVGQTYRVDLTIPGDVNPTNHTLEARMTDHFEAMATGAPVIGPRPSNGYATLLTHPLIAENLVWVDINGTPRPYAQWTRTEKKQLRSAIDRTERRNDTGMSSLPNLAAMRNPLSLGFSKAQAWNLFLARVAQSLWVERNRIVPWSLLDYTPDQIKFLLNASTMFQPSGTEYIQVSARGFALEWRPRIGFDFLTAHKMVKHRPQDTIFAFTDWLRGYSWHVSEILSHGDLATSRQTLLVNFGVEAGPTVESVLYSKPGGPQFAAGCWGTGGLYSALLATVNIPVRYDREDSMWAHMRPYFPTVDLYLPHGDDAYEAQFQPHFPGMPTSGIFWPLARYNTEVPPCNSAQTCAAQAPLRSDQEYRVLATRAVLDHLAPGAAGTFAYTRGAPYDSTNPQTRNSVFSQAQTDLAHQRLEAHVLAIGSAVGATGSDRYRAADTILRASEIRFREVRHALP